MKSYLAGAITSDPDYIKKFERFETYLNGDVKNPIRFKPFLGIENWTAYMITCLWVLSKTKAVYFIPDWKTSKGARIEFRFAKMLGKKCYQINPPPEDVRFFKVVEQGALWAAYRRNPVTGKYILSKTAVKFQKLW